MTIKVLDSISDRELEILRLISQGSSDREIAQKLYLSINTVKWHNRQIYQKLAVSRRTEAVAEAEKQGLLDEKSPAEKPTYKVRKHNLPVQISSFIGREAEIVKIKELLETNRLVTLTGPGGVGKTRLALQVASDLLSARTYEDGIFIVELASETRPDRIGNVILESLDIVSGSGRSSQESLISYLKTKNLLLLLDNFEHLLDGAEIVSKLLETTLELIILCTSREPLKLSGEQTIIVKPMDILPSQELFIERAQKINHEFIPNQKDLNSIEKICANLDRLPLAIELAAARMNLFSPQSLLERLDDKFKFLSDSPKDVPERHSALNRAIDWSYELLNEEEKTLFRRLAVFKGGWTIDAVEKVCCQDLIIDAFDGMVSLFSKSLIQHEVGNDGELRFNMLETIHEYSRECLKQNKEKKDVGGAHAEYYCQLAEEAKYVSRGGPNQVFWLKRLGTESRNILSMFDWSMGVGDSSLGLRMFGVLGHVWGLIGIGEDRPQFVKLALEKIHESSLNIQADIFSVAGRTYFFSGDNQLSNHMYNQAVEAYKQLGNRRDAAWTEMYQIYPLLECLEDCSHLKEIIYDIIKIFDQIKDFSGMAAAFYTLGAVEKKLENFDKARLAQEKSLELNREHNDGLNEVGCLLELGILELRVGNAERAQELFLDSIKLELSLEFSRSYAIGTFIALSGSAIGLGSSRRAAVLLGAVEQHYLMNGFVLHPDSAQQYSDFSNAARSQLDELTFRQAWQEGMTMTADEAITFALEEHYPA